MSRKAERPQSRRHIFIFDEDWEFVAARVETPGTFIKQLLHRWVVAVRAQEAAAIDAGRKPDGSVIAAAVGAEEVL